MDGQRFDSLTRAFAASTDRRRLFKFFGSAAIASAIGISVSGSRTALAQGGTAGPGDPCTVDDDCAQGSCSAATETESGVCYCDDPDRPVIGCTCVDSDSTACGGRADLCCRGTCVSPMVTCAENCSEPGTSCADTGCCTAGECTEEGWCFGCYSGTEDPCGGLNAEFGLDYICCTFGDETPGIVGRCLPETSCIVEPPNTGTGTIDNSGTWIAPATAIGVAAAVVAYKGRANNTEKEA